MTGATRLALALLCAASVWRGALAADSLAAQEVLELGGERWRAVGTLTSSVTGAELVIFEEEATRRGKIARRDAPPFPGVTILAVSSAAVSLEVDGRAIELTITRGSGRRLGRFAAPGAPPPEAAAIKPKAPLAFARVRLTLGEFQDSARVLRQALRSGGIGLGHNEQGIFGVLIEESPPGGIIERLGLQPGDVVVAVDGRPAASEAAARALLDGAAADRRIPYAFRRGEAVGQGVVEVVADPS